MKYKFAEGDIVLLHSLGVSVNGIDTTVTEFYATIKGISTYYPEGPLDPATIWIVELHDKTLLNTPFSCVTIPQSCIKAAN
jgi:hypothetical protein